MQLSELRNFTASSQYQDYLRLQSYKEQKDRQDAELLAKHPDYAQLVSSSVKITEQHSLYLNLNTLLKNSTTELEKHEAQYKEISDAKLNNAVLAEYYKASLEDLTQEYLDSLSKTLTEVYQTVYAVTNKEVVLYMEDYRGKKVIRMSIVNHLPEGPFKEDLTNDGGSAQIILGSIVSIYFNLMTGGPRVLFLDESLSALDTPILHRYLTILKRFSSELDFVFIIIEHAAFRMQSFVDQIYTIDNGVYSEVPPEKWQALFEKTAGEVNE